MSTDNTLFAAIDLGSNSFHIIIARELGGRLQVIDRHKEMVRMRAGLQPDGRLTPEAEERALACLRRFGQLISHIPPENVRCVGTNTLRNMQHSAEFLKKAREALGHDIHTISGQEEARLIYLGVAHGLPHSDEQRLVIDIGGGSTEFIIGHHYTHQHLTSTEMGCVSFSQKFFANGTLTGKRFDKAITRARQILRPYAWQLKQLGWDAAYGASGTIKSLGAIIEANGWGEQITYQGLTNIRDALIEAGTVDNLSLKGLKDERKPVIAGGLAVLMGIFETLPITTLQVSPNALREGLIYDMLGRLVAEDAREVSIRALQAWTRVDPAQAARVAKTARVLYRQVHNSWKLHSPDFDYAKLLHWAAEVHECGKAISLKKYRAHSAYLVEQSELAGFSQQEKAMLAAMVYNHRGKIDLKRFQVLMPPHDKRLRYLTLLLRLAVALHRGREPDTPDPMLVLKDKKTLQLTFDTNWLAAHPMTVLDLHTEAKHLQDIGFSLEF